jgi:hypothetical protein
MKRKMSLFFKSIMDFLPYGFNLPCAFGAAEHKIGSKAAMLFNIEHDDIPGLLLRSNFNSQMCQFFSFQECFTLL